MTQLFANNAVTTLNGAITAGATSIPVTDGSVFPSPSGGDYFLATLSDGANIEIVKCTARSTNVLTVARGQEGTTGFAFADLDVIELRATAETFGNLSQVASPETFTGEKTFTETKETVYDLTGTDIDPANGSMQYKTVSANTTFTESMESGQGVTLRVSGGDTYTITWPTITWVGGSAPTLTADDLFVIFKEQSTLYGSYVGSVA